MFGNLRKKLNNAIQDGIIITENLQQQYRQRQSSASNSNATTPTLDESIRRTWGSNSFGPIANDVVLPGDVNMTAGCNLLSKYEHEWKLLHDANEENARKAEQVATQIEEIGKNTATLHIDIKDLVTCLSGVPGLVTKLNESLETLGNIQKLSAKVETELVRLEDLNEECDLQEYMLHKQCELSQFKQMKMIELESYRQHVAAEQQKKIRQHEQKLRRIQRERQAVFDDAFRGDLDEYKAKGTLGKIRKDNLKTTVVLEEVVLEDPTNKDALEDFLNG